MSSRRLGAVVIADAHPLERLALAGILKDVFSCESITCVGEWKELEQSLSAATSLAVLDLDLPGTGSPEHLRHLHIRYPHLKIVVVSESWNMSSVMSGLSAGIYGFVPKTLSRPELLAAFRLVADGQVFVPRQICELAAHLNASELHGIQKRTFHLSERQMQVLRLACEGLSNKQIGRNLHISESTVKVHMSAAFKALSVNNRAEAIAAFRVLDSAQGSLL